jgi:hypothetical protein
MEEGGLAHTSRVSFSTASLGRRGVTIAVTNPKIADIGSRWTAVGIIVEGWGQIPAGRRERVLADIEEASRESRGCDEQHASDLTAAVDALDVMGRFASLDVIPLAVSDIRELLRLLDEAAVR